MLQDLKYQLENAEILVKENEPLKAHTSFKIGGNAALFAEIDTARQFCDAVSILKQYNKLLEKSQKVRCYYLGNGSNVLFGDNGFDGLVLHLSKRLSRIEIKGTKVSAMAGASLQKVCVEVQKAGLSGLEFAYGIPGSVGGAVYMNAGAYGGEMKDVLTGAVCVDKNGQIQMLSAEQLNLGYRTSCFESNGWGILWAEMELKKGDKEAVWEQMQDYMMRRKTKQPLDKPSAGSAFKRPQGSYASALIDQCGLKGYRVGGAAISEKHAGFIVNLGGATCQDVLDVADQVAAIVKEKTGFVLEKEIRVVK